MPPHLAAVDAPPRPDRAWVVWLTAGGCDGCTMSVLGAVRPTLEELIAGDLTDIPRVELVHPVLSVDSGSAYVAQLEAAACGELSPLLVVVEGALFDQSLAGEGSFSGLGERDGQPIPVEEWVRRIAPQADAVIGIGTCAVSGGVPAAIGSPTGAMGLGDLLGSGFESRAGLPIVNLPGCAPSGDAFIEAVSYVVLHLQGLVPLDIDALGRPRWLYAEETPVARPQLPWLPTAPEPQMTAACPVPQRGWINRLGGCAAVGGGCNGCTLLNFPDATLPLAVPRAQ
jgi:hydrogenase small subunit